MVKPNIVITMGDAAGIGAEITVKALNNKGLYERCVPVVYGDYAAMQDSLEFTGINLNLNLVKNASQARGQYGLIDLVDFGLLRKGDWEYKKVNAKTGNAAFLYVKSAIENTMAEEYDAIVTGPINKEAINLAGHHYSGHTEILADLSKTSGYGMLLSCNKLNVIHVTTHVSMEEACRRITKKRVYDVIHLALLAMRLLGKENPRIAVAGFNAHCSENGLFGTQEADAIIPAVELARAEGLLVDGPIPPDTVFVKAISGKYDIVVAMYHDQGHIPLKLVGFKMDASTNTYSSMSGINCTIGLPFVRTSVDHGTAFGKAGDNRANEGSLAEALDAAIVMSANMRKLPRPI